MGNFVIANLVAKLVADTSGFSLSDATGATKEFEEEAKNAESSSRDFALSFDDLATMMVTGAAAIGTAIIAMKKVLDLAEEGAAITQTAESFDLLIEKVGASNDLLKQLKDASRDTISEMDLMSSTMTLLAGASGDFATELANATPQLMEIAKAANKLNPALGDTAYMYESIAAGVKRAQPDILDNLGLNIKLGDAYAKTAEQLGKTVVQLTAEEKQMGLLNATLEAGNILIQQVGESTVSATDPIAELKVHIEELGNAAKEAVNEGVNPLVFYLNSLYHLGDPIVSQGDKIVQMMEDLGMTTEEQAKITSMLVYEQTTEAAVLEMLNALLKLNADGMKTGSGVMVDYGAAVGDVSDEIALAAAEADELANSNASAANATEGLAGALNKTSSAAEKTRESIESLNAVTFDLTGKVPDLVGEVQGLDDELKFAEAGGLGLEAAIGAIAALDVDPAVKHEMLDAALIAATNLEIALGNMTAEEGAQLLFEELDLTSLEDAQALLGTGPDNLRQLIQDVTDLATLNLDSAAVVNALGLTQQQIDLMKELDGMSATVHINYEIEYDGGPPPTGGGQASDTLPEPEAWGGHVFEGTRYLVGEHGPEEFIAPRGGEIVPSHDLGGGGGPQVEINNTYHQYIYNQAAIAILKAHNDAALIMDIRSVL